eukprot:CAMPEP_0194401430 /NCGR_PEP_ID=MMETSP0176-20130528/7_1 /TAXON_ID=216777 /ORGANISM="Proboscia alata, Strain PI-D3" /LENGTH=52 /DNA_ID=CAMNT_0039198139 /DNA_START=49 /DNA_END=204 /DNA_ORIENTATION=-
MTPSDPQKISGPCMLERVSAIPALSAKDTGAFAMGAKAAALARRDAERKSFM